MSKYSVDRARVLRDLNRVAPGPRFRVVGARRFAKALTVRCSACGSPKDAPCIDVRTFGPFVGQLVHDARLALTSVKATSGMTRRLADGSVSVTPRRSKSKRSHTPIAKRVSKPAPKEPERVRAHKAVARWAIEAQERRRAA